MDRSSLLAGSFVLLIAVGFGAFGAHGLKDRLDPAALAQWGTAVQYQFYHGLALLGLAALAAHLPQRAVRAVRGLFLAGLLCFCGSIYLLSTRELLGTHGITPVLGPVTPLGGLLFMAGWGTLFITAVRKADKR